MDQPKETHRLAHSLASSRALAVILLGTLCAACPALAPAPQADADTPDGSTDGDADSDADGDADSDANGDADSDADGDGDSDADVDGDSDADVDGDSDADADELDADDDGPGPELTVAYAKPVWLLILGHDGGIPAPTITGFGAAATFGATPSLPAGLVLDESTGAITGEAETLSSLGTTVNISVDEGEAHAETTITIRVYNGFVVDSEIDAADDDTSDGSCEDGDGRCSLRAAVEQANALAGEQAIVVPDGVYALEELTVGHRALVLTDNVVIHGQSREGTQIDGSAGARVLLVDGVLVELAFLTIQNGRTAVAMPVEDQRGAGVAAINEANLLLYRCLIADNRSTGTGAGLYLGGYSDVTILESEFRDNNSGSAHGGAIFASDGALDIERTLFVGNNGLYGSALHHTSARPVTITSSTFTGNSGLTGTIGLNTWTLAAPMTLRNVTIVGNLATSQTAGLYLNGPTNHALIGSSIIAGNTVTGDTQNCFAVEDSLITSEGFNILDDTAESCPESFGDDDLLGTDPLLESSLSDRGGPTRVLAPTPESPAIDSVGATGECAELDQVGSARPLDGDDDGTAACDIGAYEVPTP